MRHLSQVLSLDAMPTRLLSAGEFLGVWDCVFCTAGDLLFLTAESLFLSLNFDLDGVRFAGVDCAEVEFVLLLAPPLLAVTLGGDEEAVVTGRSRCWPILRGVLAELTARLDWVLVFCCA